MATESMRIDVLGRVRNTHLPRQKALLPLFEAVINSLQAIDDRKTGKGRVEIRVLRDHAQRVLSVPEKETKGIHPIVGFSIVDDGIGFDDVRFDAFLTADSRLRQSVGGKGVGRFLWLKAFDCVEVDSIFLRGEESFRRTFAFQLKDDPIVGAVVKKIPPHNLVTEVRLTNLKPEYDDHVPKRAPTIAEKLLDHCMTYLMYDTCPDIILRDEDEDGPIDIKELLAAREARTTERSVTLKQRQFDVRYVRLRKAPDPSDHEIHLCANRRLATSEKLTKYIPDLRAAPLSERDGTAVRLIASVSGGYLDERVNSERTGFSFVSDDDGIDALDLSHDELLTGIMGDMREELKDDLERIQSSKFQQIEEYVRCENPRYRVLLKHAREQLDEIPAGLPNDRLDTELHRALNRAEIRLKEEGKRFFGEEADRPDDDPEFQKQFSDYLAKVTDFNAAGLAEYVAHRKTILAALQRALSRHADGRYVKEERIHNLLHPMRVTSDDSDFANQNLWIVDEKLTYHSLLASDLRLSQIGAAGDGTRRPDILIFDRPTAYAEGTYPYQSIVIIELKRPERNEYDDDENPIQQVFGYIDELRSNKSEDKNRNTLRLDESTRFYCYVIASLTPKILKYAKQFGFVPMPDRLGYYGFNQSYNAYIEVVGYEKLISDATKRNRVLFDKLGLP